ncbi:MAG: hypothetical protein HQ463_02950 [Bacteroidetes bacterium]|nr:hypothetical protein [Bacteroidota bacterium]
MIVNTFFNKFYLKLLSDNVKRKSERIILIIAIASFIFHLIIIFLADIGLISIYKNSELLNNPIAAIYTPFSFILVYEVYLLIYYLPKSITTYIGKQYEIITLIIIRRLFKDLSNLTLSSNWFKIKYDLQFTYDLIAAVIMFFLIYHFYIQSKKRYRTIERNEKQKEEISRFIQIKKKIATLLVPILILLAIYSFLNWGIGIIYPSSSVSFKDINNVFFDQFFSVLIIADVILLLFSFFLTDEFHVVIRNSGFIISTILIRLSFSVTGLLNTILIISAILFGLFVLIIHNKFEKQIALETTNDKPRL